MNVHGILEEAKFYGIQEMVDRLQHIADFSSSVADDNAPLTRRDVIKALIRTSFQSELRFQVLIQLKKFKDHISN